MASGLDIPDDERPWALGGPLTPQAEFYNNAIDLQNMALNSRYAEPSDLTGHYREHNPQLVMTGIERLLAARGEHWRQYLQRSLFDPLGIEGASFTLDAFGHPHAYAWVLMRPRDWARLGLLHLRKGDWFGQRLLTERFIGFTRTPAPGWQVRQEESGAIYAAGFWRPDPRREAGSDWGWLPDDAVIMNGHGEQKVIILPGKNAVIVRFGHVPATSEQLVGDPATGKQLDAFQRWVNPGLRDLYKAIR